MKHQYDVALSFAGEQRAYVDEVAKNLLESGVSVFYDRFEEANLWGENLYTYLRSVYAEKARFTVIFCSKDYANKLWTNHERESAQERALKENRAYILPARFDDTTIPGIPDTIGYIDLRKKKPIEFSYLLLKKIRAKSSSLSHGLSGMEISLTDNSMLDLVTSFAANEPGGIVGGAKIAEGHSDMIMVSSTIECIVNSLKLATWSEWTSFTLSPEPKWPLGFDEDIYDCYKKVMTTIWPEKLEELKRASYTLVKALHEGAQDFLRHAEVNGNWYTAIRFYKEGMNWNPNYDADLERFNEWINECYEWVYAATKAANWFSSVVRRDVDPRFLANKGKFLIEEGPFLDGKFRSSVIEFTEQEKKTLPESLFFKSKESE
jgi:hypothetical protein